MKSSDTKLAELLDRAVASGAVIKGGGSWYSFGETRLGQGVDKTVAFLADNAETVAAIEAALAPKQEATQEHSTDAPPKPKRDAEAPGNGPGASETAPAIGGASRPEARAAEMPAGEFVTLAWPLPADMPEAALKAASIVLKSKSPRGRRRAGFALTRDETVVAFVDLSEEQLGALTGDSEIVVAVRFPKQA